MFNAEYLLRQGEGGVGMASIFLGSKYNKKEKHIVSTALHELHHTQGGGFSVCLEWGKMHIGRVVMVKTLLRDRFL